MKFLVPNYSCLQNPWLRGYCPQIPVLSVLCPQLNLLNTPRKKFLSTPLVKSIHVCKIVMFLRDLRFPRHLFEDSGRLRCWAVQRVIYIFRRFEGATLHWNVGNLQLLAGWFTVGQSETNSYRAYQPLKMIVLRTSKTSFYVKLPVTYSNILEAQNPSLMVLSMYQYTFNVKGFINIVVIWDPKLITC